MHEIIRLSASVSHLVAVALTTILVMQPMQAFAEFDFSDCSNGGCPPRELAGPELGGLVIAAMIGALVIASKRRRK